MSCSQLLIFFKKKTIYDKSNYDHKNRSHFEFWCQHVKSSNPIDAPPQQIFKANIVPKPKMALETAIKMEAACFYAITFLFLNFGNRMAYFIVITTHVSPSSSPFLGYSSILAPWLIQVFQLSEEFKFSWVKFFYKSFNYQEKC